MSALLKHQVTFVLLSHGYGKIHLSSSEQEYVLGTEGWVFNSTVLVECF